MKCFFMPHEPLHLLKVILNCSIFKRSSTCFLWMRARMAHWRFACKPETFVNCLTVDAWIPDSVACACVTILTKIHTAFRVLSWSSWSVFWLVSGHTLHSYQAQRGRSNFLCPVFREDNVIVVTLAHGWHTATTLLGRLRHFVQYFILQNGSDVHITPLLWINRSWDWIMHGVITQAVFCISQGCV